MSSHEAEISKENLNLPDNRNYPLKPILIDAKIAHQENIIRYSEDGVITLHYPELNNLTGQSEVLIPLTHQHPVVLNTLNALGNALSALANSPVMEGGHTLRERYEEEVAHYTELSQAVYEQGGWEPDYGSYVYDHFGGRLYLIAPEEWHRLALVTSQSRLIADPEGKLSWQEIRRILENRVVGFAGTSVGGGILEGWMREGRPKQVKITDLDKLEANNLNRAERGSMRFLGTSRAERFDPRSPYDTPGINKAVYTAYEQHMVDPYAQIWIYQSGLDRTNMAQFLLGNGSSEPKLDVLVEETDDVRFKIEVRQYCQRLGIPVLMMSDFGQMVQGQFQDYRIPGTPLGYEVSDEEVIRRYHAATAGGRQEKYDLIEALCGPDFRTADDEFGKWIRGEGEQPTASLPQSGATAMSSGGIGGKALAMHFLGHRLPERFIYDLQHFTVKKD